MVYHEELVAFVRSGRDWVSNLAKPGIVIKASEDVEMLLRSTESHILRLRGSIPSPLSGCSNGSKHKRRAGGLFAIIPNLIGDALALARCVEAIAEDLSAEMRQLIKQQPPSPEMIKLIVEQLDALKQVSDEQEKEHSSTADSASSVPESTISTTPSPSPSSSTASSSSTTVESCSATYTDQADDDDDADDDDADDDDATGYRGSLVKNRRHSAPDLIKRKKNPLKSINAIGNTQGECRFPDGKKATQPPYLTYGKFIGLDKQRNANNGANERIFNAASKWYVVVRAGKYFWRNRLPSKIRGVCQLC